MYICRQLHFSFNCSIKSMPILPFLFFSKYSVVTKVALYINTEIESLCLMTKQFFWFLLWSYLLLFSHQVVSDSYGPIDCSHQAALSVGFPRYWNGLLFPTPGNSPTQGLNPCLSVSCIVGGFFTTEPWRKSLIILHKLNTSVPYRHH